MYTWLLTFKKGSGKDWIFKKIQNPIGSNLAYLVWQGGLMWYVCVCVGETTHDLAIATPDLGNYALHACEYESIYCRDSLTLCRGVPAPAKDLSISWISVFAPPPRLRCLYTALFTYRPTHPQFKPRPDCQELSQRLAQVQNACDVSVSWGEEWAII